MKSKNIFLAILLSAILLSGCASTSIEHLSADEFLNKTKIIEHINSAIWVSYVGSSETRAYLEYGDVLAIGGRTRTIIYWTELNRLPKDTEKKLRAGISPWIPWQEKNKKANDNNLLPPNG